VQLLDLAFPRLLAIPTDPGVKGSRRLILELLLPAVNLVRVNFVPLRQLADRHLLAQRLKGDLGLQASINLPSRPLRLLPLRLL
jgi:hypothetical protein